MLPTELHQPRSYGDYLRYSIETTVNGTWMVYDVPKLDLNLIRCGIDEAAEAAKLIYEQYGEGRPIYLPISGGIDSECMAQAFAKAKVPFQLVAMRFKNGFNQHDMDDLAKFFDAEKVQFVDLDLDKFYETGLHLNYAQKYQCCSPQIATHLWLADQLDGCVVFPHNPPPLNLTDQNKVFFKFPRQLFLSYDRFFNINNRPGVGLFYYHTPELLYSFILSDYYRDLSVLSDTLRQKYSWDDYLIKTSLYRSTGFKAVDRYSKYTGFETYRKTLNKIHNYPPHLDYYDQHFRKPMLKISNDQQLQGYGKFDLPTIYSAWFPE